jgi:hypothetical protein
MLARCQFGVHEDGTAGATLTYPISGYPWRRNVRRSFSFCLTLETTKLLFEEPLRIRTMFPEQCLHTDALWNDASEKGNGITRDRELGILCYGILITAADGSVEEQFSLRETDIALTGSLLYQVFTELVTPYEQVEGECGEWST